MFLVGLVAFTMPTTKPLPDSTWHPVFLALMEEIEEVQPETLQAATSDPISDPTIGQTFSVSDKPGQSNEAGAGLRSGFPTLLYLPMIRLDIRNTRVYTCRPGLSI